MAKKSKQPNMIKRPPVIVVMGHIDHGKSTLLDFIRKSNVVDGEAGGITQHISAYEVEHESKEHGTQKITFLDTPGHEAFGAMRSRGADVADIAILMVSADDGVKAQTLEAYKSILDTGIPYIVAINKIDKPDANVQKTISSLIENEIYIEGYGGDVPSVQISAKQGTNVEELLDTILLVAELEEFTADAAKPASGVVIETNVDPKKGISATLVLHDGTIRQGMHVVAGKSSSPVRIMEDFTGKSIKEASVSAPIRITGFDAAPEVGAKFECYESKKEAKNAALNSTETSTAFISQMPKGDKFFVPVVIKADVVGSIEAIAHEIEKICSDNADIIIVNSGIGDITENDIRMAASKGNAFVLGFNVSASNSMYEIAERQEVTIQTFTIIYELTQWIADKVEECRPRIETKEVTGSAKILKTFSKQKDKQVIGGRLLDGELTLKSKCKIIRNDHELGEGVILDLQQQKASTQTVKDGEFGTQIESKVEIAPGDIIEAYIMVKK